MDWRSPQQLLKDCDRYDLAFASNAERPFGLVQAAVSGAILLRSYIFAVQGDRF
jgi:hypothetical protein